MSRVAQGSVEVTIITAFAFIAIAIIFYALQKEGSGISLFLNLATAKNALEELDAAGNSVYEQGIGSQTFLTLSLPRDIKNITLNKTEIRIYYNTGNFDYRSLNYNATGSVTSLSEGMVKIKIKNTVNGICFGNTSACQ